MHRDEFGPSPLRSGARVMLRAHNGALLSVCDNQTVRAVWREVRGRRQAFTIKKIGPGPPLVLYSTSFSIVLVLVLVLVLTISISISMIMNCY